MEAKQNEKFYQSYSKVIEELSRVVSLDEKSTMEDREKKIEIIKMYRKSIVSLQNLLKIANQIPYDLNVEKRTKALGGHIQSAKGRMKYLEEFFSVAKVTTKAAACDSLRSKRHSANTATTGCLQSQRASTSRKAEPVRPSRSDLLKSVDAKIGGPLLNEILASTEDIKFADVEGLQSVKKELEEAVILPGLNPKLFTGLRQPVQGILLFGPPGNGKTMITRALANECGCATTFFNVSASLLTSKWVGEAEKIVRTLFQIARNGQPSIIFIDEIDSVLHNRAENESEMSRRLKSEFLIQMDGLCSSSTDKLLLIGATNRPYELDSAILRRFPKRIFVDLPDVEARKKLIVSLLQKNHVKSDLSPSDLRKLAERTVRYSNCDLASVCRDAAMTPIRELSRSQLKQATEALIRPITRSDFETALASVKPSTNEELRKKLMKFAENVGQF